MKKILSVSAFLMISQLAHAEILAVQSAADGTPGLPTRGGLGSLYARGLTDLPKLVVASQFPLPTQLAGVSIRVRGILAPILAVANFDSFQQVNFQVPNEPAGNECSQNTNPPNLPVVVLGDPVAVSVEYGGQTISAMIRPLTAVVQGVSTDFPSPGQIFPIQGSGAFFHADWSLITSDHPAASGETIIILATGLGPTSPVVPTGQAAPSSPPAVFASGKQCVIAGEDEYLVSLHFRGNGALLPFVPSFVGLAPGLAGVFQLNVKLDLSLLSPNAAPFSLALDRYYCEGHCFVHSGMYESMPMLIALKF